MQGFWDEEWFGSRTRGSTVVDVLFGVLLPIACFALDPGVLWGGGPAIPLASAPLAVYVIAGASALAMLAWVTVGGRHPRFDAVLAGILMVGSLLAITAAVFLLPFAIIGIILFVGSIALAPPFTAVGLMGVLGLVPFMTGFVCFRAATRILGAQTPWPRGLRAAGGAALLCAVAVGYQVGVDRVLDRSVVEIARGQDPMTRESAIRTLNTWRPVVPRREFARRGTVKAFQGDPLADAYSVAYQRVTGTRIEDTAGFVD